MNRVLGHWFKDPTGDARKDVYVELEIRSQAIYLGSACEPADYDWQVRRLSIGDYDVPTPFAPRFRKLTEFMLEHAS